MSLFVNDSYFNSWLGGRWQASVYSHARALPGLRAQRRAVAATNGDERKRRRVLARRRCAGQTYDSANDRASS